MRKRLPQPKAKIDTLAPVRPSVRVGKAAAGGSACATSFSNQAPAPVAAPNPTFSRNFLRERSLLMGSSSECGDEMSAVLPDSTATPSAMGDYSHKLLAIPYLIRRLLSFRFHYTLGGPMRRRFAA